MTTENLQSDIVTKAFIHSCHVRHKTGSSVVIKEKIKYSDGSVKPNVTVINNPRRSFYITQKRYQNYTIKPEYELMSRLDKYTCYDHELHRKLAEVLNINANSKYIRPEVLFKSPYVFGADISIEALIKMYYHDQYPGANLVPTVGFLDIETSIDTGQIILISYMHDNVVHTGILKSFLFEEDTKKNRKPISKEAISQYVKATLDSKAAELSVDPKQTERAQVISSLTYDIEIFDSEIKLIAWIFKCIHQAEIDFISIWNMHFDIPKIVASIEAHKYQPAAFFSNPSLSKDLHYFNYRGDQERSVDHFTLRWPWVYSTCTSQCVDAMGLYSQCRRTAGYLDSYTLDAVLDREVGLGKLPLTSGSHVIMQRHHFKDYVAYNIFDVIGLRFLEDKNKDVLTMMLLSVVTPVNKFATATTKATNNMYHALINKGMVFSSYSRDDSFVKYDVLFPKEGGAVLAVGRVRNVGIPLSI